MQRLHYTALTCYSIHSQSRLPPTQPPHLHHIQPSGTKAVATTPGQGVGESCSCQIFVLIVCWRPASSPQKILGECFREWRRVQRHKPKYGQQKYRQATITAIHNLKGLEKWREKIRPMGTGHQNAKQLLALHQLFSKFCAYTTSKTNTNNNTYFTQMFHAAKH